MPRPNGKGSGGGAVPRNRPAAEAWEALFRAQVTVMRRLRRGHGTGPVSMGEYDVLYNLSLQPGRRARLRDLNELILLSQPSLSRMIERMEADGLVERSPDPCDRRGTVVALTGHGLEMQRIVGRAHVRLISTYVGGALSPEELRTLRRLCDKLRLAQADLPDPD